MAFSEESNDYLELKDAWQKGDQQSIQSIVGNEYNNATDLLYYACEEEHLEIAEVLLNHPYNVNPNIRCGLLQKQFQLCLSVASSKGFLEIASLLISKGADIDALEERGNIALCIACEEGHSDIAEMLIHKGGTRIYVKGHPILQVASSKGLVTVAKLLIEKGAEVNEYSGNSDSGSFSYLNPLFSACRGGHREMVEFLFERGAKLNDKDLNATDLLYSACKDGHLEIVKLLLNHPHNVDPNTIGINWLMDAGSCLFIACKKGFFEIASLLITKGADVNAFDKDRCSSLFFACKEGYSNVAQLLIEKDAKVNEKNWECVSILSMACSKGLVDIAKLMIEKGAEIHSLDNKNRTPLFWACNCGHSELAKFLIERGAQISTMNSDSYSILSITCYRGLYDIAKIMIEKGAKIDYKEKIKSPFVMACAGGHSEIALYLLNNGVSVETDPPSVLHMNKENWSILQIACSKSLGGVAVELIKRGVPSIFKIKFYGVVEPTSLKLACSNGLYEVVEAMISAGVDVNTEDSLGATMLCYASEAGHNEIVQLLIRNKSILDAKKHSLAPLALASSNGHTDVVISLIKAGAEIDINEPLNLASEKGHLDVVKELVKNQADLETQGKKSGFTPLMVACQYKQHDVATTLINAGAKADALSPKGKCPLSLAAASGLADVVDLLLTKGINIDEIDRDGCTPLMLACMKYHSKIAIRLIEVGAKLDILSKNGYRPLSLAAGCGLTDVVKVMLAKGTPVDVEYETWSPLYTACDSCQIRVVEELIKNKASLDRRHTEHGCTPLLNACAVQSRLNNGYIPIRLINAGADVNAINENGSTALILAVRSKSSNVVERLLKENIDLEVKDNEGKTALKYAWESEHLDILYMLINSKAELDIRNNKESLLIFVCCRGRMDIVEALIKRKVDIDEFDLGYDGRTPLSWACYEGHSDIALLLIKEGARIDLKDKNGRTALYYACSKNLRKVALKLVPEQVDRSDQNVVSALQIARNKNWTDVENKLLGKDIKIAEEESLGSTIEEESSVDMVDDKALPRVVDKESSGQNSESSILTVNKDYSSYLEAAAKDGTIKSKRTGLGVIGASETGKSSMLNLLLDKPLILKHCSTPVARPLKGIWMINRNNQWEKNSSDILTRSIAGSVWKRMEEREIRKATAEMYSPPASHGTERLNEYVPLPVDLLPLPATSTQLSLPVQTTTTKPIYVSILDLPATREVAEILESGQDYKSLENLHFMNVIDSGGQAPFLDIAPSLFPYSSINLVVFKLNEPLKSEITFNYAIDGKVVGSEKRKITTEQLIAAAVSSKAKLQMPQIKGLVYKKSNEKPKCMMIGTHYDKYLLQLKHAKENMESLQAKNELLDVLLEDFEDVLFPNNEENTIFPLNTLSRDEETLLLAGRIRKVASQCYTEVEVPVKWYLFQIAIEELKSRDEEVVSFSTFLKIGKKRNMDEDETNAALEYFHDLNVCLYYPHVLPHVVFTSPQYLFDLISKLMAISFHETSVTSDVTPSRATVNRLKKGIFRKDLVASFSLNDNCSADDFLKLMCHLYIATPLPESDTYFMPCLLKSCDHPTNDDLKDTEIKPLLFTWNNVVPHGLFTSLVSYLTQSHAIRFQLDRSQKQYRNKVTLFCIGFLCQVVIFEHPTFVGLTTTLLLNEAKKASKVLNAVRDGIQAILKSFNQQEYLKAEKLAYLCEIPKCQLDHSHVCYSDDEREFLTCSKNTKLRVKQSKAHQIWFGYTEDSLTIIAQKKPKIKDVYKLLKGHSTKWDSIGREFLVSVNDRKGLRTDKSFDNNGRLEEVLYTWLEEETSACTWEHFIKILRDELNMKAVVRETEKFLRSSEAVTEYSK